MKMMCLDDIINLKQINAVSNVPSYDNVQQELVTTNGMWYGSRKI